MLLTFPAGPSEFEPHQCQHQLQCFPVLPTLYSCPFLSDSSLSLSVWVRFSPILASSEASTLLGYIAQCPWLSSHLLVSLAHSGLYLSLCLALLPPLQEPLLYFTKTYPPPGENPVFPLHPAIFSHSFSLLLFPSLPVFHTCVRVHGQCYLSTAGYRARGFDETFVAFLLVNFDSLFRCPPVHLPSLPSSLSSKH